MPTISVYLEKGKTMIDKEKIDNIASAFFNSLPAGLQTMQKDAEKNVRAAMHTTFSKLDLVTREEFDVQASVLARTRSKLEALEKQVQLLEESLPKTE